MSSIGLDTMRPSSFLGGGGNDLWIPLQKGTWGRRQIHNGHILATRALRSRQARRAAG
jgi:hypothetical protein